ncbi:MAG TPA: hypothetical protein VHC70_13610 [Phycisphaerales bacterium]|jgi:hypothetical protein|nr:hypothetical protein [Phycisphaerales bacterium]
MPTITVSPFSFHVGSKYRDPCCWMDVNLQLADRHAAAGADQSLGAGRTQLRASPPFDAGMNSAGCPGGYTRQQAKAELITTPAHSQRNARKTVASAPDRAGVRSGAAA